MSSEKVKEFSVIVKSIRKATWGKLKMLGKAPAFKTLNIELATLDYKACTSWSCPDPIKPTSQFSKKAKSCNGLRSICKLCDNGDGSLATVEASKQAGAAVADAIAAKDYKISSVDVESVAHDWLIFEMKQKGVQLIKNLEFRVADGGGRVLGSNTDSWLQIQLKANGPFGKDGVPMSNDRLSLSGRAGFDHCRKEGYKDMLMIFIKTRIAADGTRVYTIWVCTGVEVTKDTQHETADGTLGPTRIKPITLDALAQWIRTSTLPRVTWEHMFKDVTSPLQRKEIVLMLATRATGATVAFREGNQTSVDCLVDNVAEQAKTYHVASGSANASHRVKGHQARPYTANDGIERMREGLIVKSGEKFYLLYAVQTLHYLLCNGIFAHEGYCGQPKSSGKGTISVPLQIFEVWLRGKNRKNPVREQCLWLVRNKSLGFRRPVEIIPGQWGIPAGWLEEAAYTAIDPSAFPTEKQLAELDELVEKHSGKPKPEPESESDGESD